MLGNRLCATLPARIEDHSIHFHQYHLEDMGRIRTRKVCEIEDREVSQAEIGKGYKLTKTQVIPITDEELRDLPLPTAKAIEIEAFVPLKSVDPIRIAEGYYLQPAGQVAAKPYKLLRQALERSSKVAVAKYAWSGRERLGLPRVRGDAIVLHAMRWPDEIRDPAELLPPAVEVSEGEIEGALALMESMTREDLEGEEFHDSYTEAVAKIIESKREDKPLPEAPEPKEQGQVLDLLAALQESVRKAQASRGETDDADADVHDLAQPKKKTAAKKTAKKTTAKKTTEPAGAKKTAAKKTAKKTSARRPRSA
ncbi:Ku protein [Streptomyces scabiei]|uniref:non-homologous end joining protein Ku n=1 Tax=Streptomyces scabiei TaxID=1930 RepID=UPI0029A75CC8|nr:Ku protein [Streptomyces scabiei]MDX3114520.1 Ku protein [Streptomyces scabiei]